MQKHYLSSFFELKIDLSLIKYILKISILLFLISCEKPDDEISAKESKFTIDKIFPLKAVIGDTITIEGSNLENLQFVVFTHNVGRFGANNIRIDKYRFLYRSNEKIQVIIPLLKHDDVSILIQGGTLYPLELVGIIPIDNNFHAIRGIQVLSEKVAYLREDNTIYKSSDGFYTWQLVYKAPEGSGITSFYFLDEVHCWVGMTGPTFNVTLHYSKNGGADFNFMFEIPKGINSYGAGYIRRIQFTSPTKGYLADIQTNIFVVEDFEHQNIYDKYPELHSLPFGKIELWDFSIINEKFIFLTPNDSHYLIRMENGNISYSEFPSSWPNPPMLFDNVGYLESDDVYKTTDSGNSWNKIDSFGKKGYFLKFLNNLEGLSFERGEIYMTSDGAISWKKIHTMFTHHGDADYTDFTSNNGLIASSRGRLLKYVKMN